MECWMATSLVWKCRYFTALLLECCKPNHTNPRSSQTRIPGLLFISCLENSLFPGGTCKQYHRLASQDFSRRFHTLHSTSPQATWERGKRVRQETSGDLVQSKSHLACPHLSIRCQSMFPRFDPNPAVTYRQNDYNTGKIDNYKDTPWNLCMKECWQHGSYQPSRTLRNSFRFFKSSFILYV